MTLTLVSGYNEDLETVECISLREWIPEAMFEIHEQKEASKWPDSAAQEENIFESTSSMDFE